MKTLEDDFEVGGSYTFDVERESKFNAPKTPLFKGVHNAKDVDNLLLHLEKYFKCNRVKKNENKINTDVLYHSKINMLFFMFIESKIGNGLWTIKKWELL